VSGNRTQAARLLGISLRCLQYKLKAYRQEGPEALGQFDRADEPQPVRSVSA
jgi:Bacterial regulatory protein, Fis family